MAGQSARSQTTGRRLRKFFLIEKLNSPLGFLFLFLLLSGVGIGIGLFGFIFGAAILAMVIAIPVVYGVVAYPQPGILLFLVLAYFLIFISKLGIVNFPIGTAMDGLEGLFLLSLFIHQKKNPDWKQFKNPITTMILIWIGYNILEFGNPTAESRMAWVYTVRTMAVIMVMYFVFVYNIRTVQFVRLIIKLWLFLAFVAALYAFKQEHIGFFGFEEEYLNSDPMIGQLLFIGGTWRKFSIFSDPVVFAYTMVVTSLLCIALMTGPLPMKKKIVLFLLMCFYIMNMLYSGTRGAYVLLPAAMLLFAILKYNKKVMAALCVMAVFFVILIYIPTSNYTLYRFQSAFKPSDDASFNLRKMNQKKIQPYIQTHPLGGGLGSTGEWGKKFAPYSYLASFPPDSGYVRTAVETGWIGLILFCTFMFTILRVGINNFYKIKDPELKSYALGMVLVVFAFHIGNYPQEALVQYPSNVYFYLVTALIVVLKRLDDQKNSAAHAQ